VNCNPVNENFVEFLVEDKLKCLLVEDKIKCIKIVDVARTLLMGQTEKSSLPLPNHKLQILRFSMGKH